MTPLAAWEHGIAALGAPRAVTDFRRFLIDFLPIERRLVRREGVVLHVIPYWSDVLRTWIGHPDPMIVRYDPRDLSRIYLLGPDGVYYDLAYRDVRRPPMSRWEQKRALKHLRKEGFSHVDDGAIFRTVDAMRAITDAATVSTKHARRQQERRRQTGIATIPRATPAGSPLERETPINRDEQQLLSNLFPVEDWL